MTSRLWGQHPSLQIFFELIQRYNISVDQFLFNSPAGKDTNRRQLDALLDDMSDTGIRIVNATAKEMAEVEKEGRSVVRDKGIALHTENSHSFITPLLRICYAVEQRFCGCRDKSLSVPEMRPQSR